MELRVRDGLFADLDQRVVVVFHGSEIRPMPDTVRPAFAALAFST